MSNVKKLLIEWDDSKVFEDEIKYRLEDNEDGLTEEEIENDVYGDSELLNLHLEGFHECLTEIIKGKNRDGFWKAEVHNFGWRNINGVKTIKAENSEELIRQILPDTDCTFKVFDHDDGLAIQNFHHDSPTGNEWYYLTPISEDIYEEMN